MTYDVDKTFIRLIVACAVAIAIIIVAVFGIFKC